ncbi:MAG: DUF642 domain-containing protein [Pirellulales bacterium]
MLTATPVFANLIVNGSFETPTVPAGSFTNYLGGSSAITGWTVVGVDTSVTNATAVQNGITFQAQDGIQWADLSAVNSNSMTNGVTQSISTTISQLYEISFYVGSATDNGLFFPSIVDLSIDGGTRVSYTNPNAPTNMLDWRLFTVNFTATNSTTNLTFFDGGASNNYLSGLDNVSVNAVPEPNTAVLGMLGILVACCWRVKLRGRREWTANRSLHCVGRTTVVSP